MTQRLYYIDSYLTHFEATILESLTFQDAPAVLLDQSPFYPTGGGQPHDVGTLNDVTVIDVISEKETGRVIHVLAAPLREGSVIGEIDWPRRFDLMQQHSGQHILSQALWQELEATTVGFHLSQAYATIDISHARVTEADFEVVEELANQIIHQNRPVTTRFISPEEIANIPLRKPPTVQGPIRVVAVQDFDWSACGGTHVSHTGEVGIIKIVRCERKKKGLRLTFLCGQRAVKHYQRVNQQIRDTANCLSVSTDELFEAVEQQTQALRQTQKERDRLHTQILGYRAQALIAEASIISGVSIITHIFDHQTIETVRQLAQLIVAQADRIVLFGLSGVKGQLMFACSENVTVSMSHLLKQVGPIIGGGGGGSPRMAQGGGPNSRQVPAALAQAQIYLEQELSSGRQMQNV